MIRGLKHWRSWPGHGPILDLRFGEASVVARSGRVIWSSFEELWYSQEVVSGSGEHEHEADARGSAMPYLAQVGRGLGVAETPSICFRMHCHLALSLIRPAA